MAAKSTSHISVKGARVHNLKNIDVEIPHGKLVVVTGLSGSGKSSLAFDTLYAEGQRRYVESLSSYARQFLGRMEKPEVDFIKGIPPAIAIEQKVNTRNPRSTVGTSTEIYDYVKLLFARLGKTYSPVSGKEVKKHTVEDVTNFVNSYAEGTKFMIMSPVVMRNGRNMAEQLEVLQKQGFSRLDVDNETKKIADCIENLPRTPHLYLVIDRMVVKEDQDTQSRMADSIETAFYEGQNECIIKILGDDEPKVKSFSQRFEADGITFMEPSEHLFSFNNPLGACPVCEGFGKVIGIDEDLIIPDKTRSIYDNAVVCWRGEKVKSWRNDIVHTAEITKFPIHTPYLELSDKLRKMLWKGCKEFLGIDDFFAKLEAKQYKIQNRVMLARYRGKTTCKECNGTRLKKEASYVKVGKKTITELVNMQIGDLRRFFENLSFTKNEQNISKRLMIEINSRIGFLCDVGLSYLTLNRLSNSLSGGESQRINLATILGSSLVGSMYVLDEPSIGLHPRDTERLISVLRKLQQLGNTVIVVEHDEDIIRSADYVLDIGPRAGRLGGEVVFADFADKLKNADTLTSKYLYGKEQVEVPKQRRQWRNYLEVIGAAENNLKGIDVKIPLEVLSVVTGVSGSGKSTLVKRILLPLLQRELSDFGGERPGSHSSFRGDFKMLHNVEFVDQNPIGKSSRSNPVTYIKAYDEIRNLFAQQKAAKMAGYKPSHFSFNVDGGRCDECQGEGTITVEMQFMADIQLLCESCKGKRFKDEILDVKYQGKTIFDILEMTVNEAIEFFSQKDARYERGIVKKLKPLQDVGLGYIKLGQSSNTLSGGESQRVKLAFFLSKERAEPTMFIFDEPTTGLHFHDVKTLLKALNALISRGHSVLVIEHNMDVVKSADWIIDLGPEGGDAGGQLIYSGTPEDMIKCKQSYTGKYLRL